MCQIDRLTAKFSRNATCKKCEGNIGEAVEQKEKMYDEVEAVGKFTEKSTLKK